MSNDKEIRAIIAIQQEIADKKREVSARLKVLIDQIRETGNTGKLIFVVDDEVWELDRWQSGSLHGASSSAATSRAKLSRTAL